MNIIADDEVVYGREKMDVTSPEWRIIVAMFNAHAKELRGMETKLNIAGYQKLSDEGRLLVIGARRKDNGAPVGYAIYTWYDEPHYGLRVAVDDAWFVFPQYRQRGIGRKLQEIALAELKKAGIKIALSRTKVDQSHHEVMEQLGYRPYEIVFRKDL